VRRGILRNLPGILLASLFAGLFLAAAHAQSPGQPVRPKQAFPSGILNVYSPDSEGWVIAGFGGNGISFAKRGSERNETYAAQVIVFGMAQTGNDDELLRLVRERIAMINPPPRFQETAADYKLNEGRGYPCVDVRANYIDNAAATPAGPVQLNLHVVALYCRHPRKPELGFFAAYSYRGKATDPGIEAAAKSFIEAIDIPK
jgi:hypothetical protein